MTSRLWLRLAEIAVTTILALALFVSWHADRRDRAQLSTELATAKQALAQAASRQHDRDAQLEQTLAAFAADKRAITTPAQIIRELPRWIPLPAPVTLQPTPPRSSVSAQAPDSPGLAATVKSATQTAISRHLPGSERQEGNPVTAASDDAAQSSRAGRREAVIPSQDLKPLYDFALDCQACQARLAAAHSDLSDERAKTAALTGEKNAALRAAKGGSLWRRVSRAAKWFAIGAAAGAVAARAAH